MCAMNIDLGKRHESFLSELRAEGIATTNVGVIRRGLEELHRIFCARKNPSQDGRNQENPDATQGA